LIHKDSNKTRDKARAPAQGEVAFCHGKKQPHPGKAYSYLHVTIFTQVIVLLVGVYSTDLHLQSIVLA